MQLCQERMFDDNKDIQYVHICFLCCSTYLNRSVLCRWTLLCNLHTVSAPALSWGIKDPLMRCNCKITINSITSEFNTRVKFVFFSSYFCFFPMLHQIFHIKQNNLNQYFQYQGIEQSLFTIHCSVLLSVMSKFIYYMWKVFLVCWDLIPETVRASMSTGSEQILATCILVKSFKSSESPSPVTSASSNQAVSQAAGEGCQPSVVLHFKLHDEEKEFRTYFVLQLLKNECLKEEENYHYVLGQLLLILFKKTKTNTFCA